MRRILATTLLALALAGCGPGSREPRVTVEDARVQLPVMEGRPGAAYFSLETNRVMRLLSVTSPQVRRIELHETQTRGNRTRMVPARNLTFERELDFEPGGYHAMLFDVDRSLRPGMRVPLVFAFDQAPPVTVEAEVVAAGGGHSGH